jgi:thioredoxin-dependent peroxiredoxin
MVLQIGDIAPDFEANTTEGRLKFHDYIDGSWVVFFSHPKDFTPVCTTELGSVAKMKHDFEKRGVKLIGISIDSVEDHKRWKDDIKDVTGATVNYPMIGDEDLSVAKLYGMIHPNASGSAKGRTAADNATVPNEHGPKFQRNRARGGLPPTHGHQVRRHPGGLETGRRRDHPRLAFG